MAATHQTGTGSAGRTVGAAARMRALARLALFAALLALPLQAAAQPADAPARIGYVDMKRLIDNAPQVLAARARLEAEFAERNARLDADAANLAQMDQRLQAGASTLPPSEAETLRRQADALRRSIERTRAALQAELDRRIDEELGSAWPAMEAAVAEYAREAGYDVVLSSPQLYASGRIDITDRVLDRLRRSAGAPSR